MAGNGEPAGPGGNTGIDAPGCADGAHVLTRDCPAECLAMVLSRMALNPLLFYCRARSSPATVGNVVDMYWQGRLRDIRQLGPRRIGEIGVALRYAGLAGDPGSEHAGPGLARAAAGKAGSRPGSHVTPAEIRELASATDLPAALRNGDITYLTVREMSGLTRLSPMTIYRMIRDGSLEADRFGRSFRIPVESARQFLENARPAEGERTGPGHQQAAPA